MTRRGGSAWLVLGLLLLAGGCKLYNPEVKDCSITCGAGDACPADTSCVNGFCRPPHVTTKCDCRPGEDRACGGGKGLCTPGLQRCSSDGTWGACLGEVKPVGELCDGKDNDCDGVIDNSPVDAPPCSKSQGVCSVATQHCVSGHYVDCDVADYGPNYQTVETRCDSLDNDCDGVVDGTGDTLLATNVVGDWVLLGYTGGFALVSVRTSATLNAQDVVVDRFDGALVRTASTVVTTSNNLRLDARNDGATVYVVWGSGSHLEGKRVAGDGSLGPLFTIDPVERVSGLQVGLSATTLVTVFTGTNTIHSVNWPLGGGGVTHTLLNRGLDGGASTVSVYDAVTSRGGTSVLWSGEFDPKDGGSTETRRFAVNVAGGAPVSVGYFGGGTANVLEGLSGTLMAVYDDSFFSVIPFFPSYSGIYVNPDLLGGASATEVRRSGDSTVWRWCNAVSTTSGSAMAYFNNDSAQVIVTSHLQVGATPVLRSRVLSSDAGSGPPRVASDGTPYLGVAFNSAGAIYGRRLCAP